MKKLDKLILSSFIGPFILTFLVVVFILLIQHMLKYFDDIVGKDIGLETLGMLMFDFAIFMTPIAIPLAVLLSSLMTFGNLGEHFELTAVKSAGISLLRTLYPIFIFVCLLTVVAFYSNNYFVPKAALNAYSVLWDIKQKKPALDLKEGAFYNGIPDISIKVNEKNSQTGEIKDVIIYDHRNRDGNKQVVLADSGRMYTIHNDSYLVLELFHGQFFIEGNANSKTVSSKRNVNKTESLSRAVFSKNKLIFDLSSFDLKETDKSLFSSNRIMRNLSQLQSDMDSLSFDEDDLKLETFTDSRFFFTYLNSYSLPLTSELNQYKTLKDSIEAVEDSIRKLEIKKEDSIIRMKELKDNEIKEKIKKERQKEQHAIKKENESVIKKNKPSTKTNSSVERISKMKGIDDREGENPASLNRDKIAKITQPNKRLKKKNINTDSIKTKKNAVAEGGESKLKINNVISDSVKLQRKMKKEEKKLAEIKEKQEKLEDFVRDTVLTATILKSAVNTVRQNKSKLTSHINTANRNGENYRTFRVQWHKIIANSFACIVMFLIGAPLGAIIKRGGLGFPVLISILFFIIFYVFTMTGEKWAKQGVIDPMLGMWSSNLLLFPIGLFFLRQARNDARLFDADFYNVVIARIKSRFSRD